MKVFNGPRSSRNQINRYFGHLQCELGCQAGIGVTLGSHDHYVLYDNKEIHIPSTATFLKASINVLGL